MANPQLQNGFLRIANELLEALYGINLCPYEQRVLLFIMRMTYGMTASKTNRLSLSQFSEGIQFKRGGRIRGTGLDRRHIHRALKSLKKRKMIVASKGDSQIITYGIQKNYSKWILSSRKATVIGRGDTLSPKEVTKNPKVSSVEAPTIYNFKDKERKAPSKNHHLGERGFLD